MVVTQEPSWSRAMPGSVERDLDRALLSLVSSGCTIEEIVRALGLPLRDVHRRLVELRHFIEDVSQLSSSY